MKRFFAFVIVCIFSFSLGGCGALDKIRGIELPPLPEATEKPLATPAPLILPEPSPEAEEKRDEPQPAAIEPGSRIIIRFDRAEWEQYDPAQGTQLILEFSYETPTVRIPGREPAAEAINAFLTAENERFYTGGNVEEGDPWGFNGMLEIAEDNYTYAVQSGTDSLPLTFTADRQASVFRADERVIAVRFLSYEFTGGAHGMSVARAYNFDAETGALLTLEDLTTDLYAFRSRVSDYMIHLVEVDPDTSERVSADYINGYGGYTNAMTSLIRDGSWYLDESGLVVFSDLYEIGPYASGIISFTIPYEQLDGLLADKWMPTERSETGELTITSMEQIEDGSVEFLDKLSISEGEELCLRAMGSVYDVQLSEVNAEDGILEGRSLWRCSCMKNSALQITDRLNEDSPDLLLRYRDMDGTVYSYLISRDANSGEAVLINPEALDHA